MSNKQWIPLLLIGQMAFISCGEREEPAVGTDATSSDSTLSDTSDSDSTDHTDKTEAEKLEVVTGLKLQNLLPLERLPFTLVDGVFGATPNQAVATQAYAVAQVKDIESNPVTLWFVRAVIKNPESELTVFVEQPDGEKEVVLRSLNRRVNRGMFLYVSDGHQIQCPRVGSMQGVLSAHCLITGDSGEVVGAKKLELLDPIGDNHLIQLPQGIAFSEEQFLLPIFNQQDELVSLAYRAKEPLSWVARPLPDLVGQAEPVIGPFTMTASISKRYNSNTLGIDISGPLRSGIADNGRFDLCFGPKDDAEYGFDAEGRAFIANPNDLRSSTLRPVGTSDGQNGVKNLHARAELPLDADTAEMVGQLFWSPRNGPAIPFPPFEVSIKLTGSKKITVTGNQLFQFEQNRATGESQSEYLSDATILDIKGEAVPNQTLVLGDKVVIAMKREPRVRIYSFSTSELETLPTQITGYNLLIAGYQDVVCILDTKDGVIEKWDLAKRELVTAGLVEDPQDVLAMGMVKGTPNDYIVFACRKQLRFLDAVSLESCSPLLLNNGRSPPSDSSIDGYEAIMREHMEISGAVASQTDQGSAVHFRFFRPNKSEHDANPWLVVMPSIRVGAVRPMGYGAGISSLGPYGASYFRYNNVSYSREPIQQMGGTLWNSSRVGSMSQRDMGVFYPFPSGINLLLATSREKGVIPTPGFSMEVHDLGSERKEPIALGNFNELAGCMITATPDLPHMSKHLFISPDGSKMVTLNGAGTKLYQRDFNKQAVLDKFAGGNFTLKSSAPTKIIRGTTMVYLQDATGAKNTEFKLLEGPSGATISDQGLLKWYCPPDLRTDSVQFVIQATNSDRNLNVENTFEVQLYGPASPLLVKAEESVPRREPSLRVFEVPEKGVIVDKLELAHSRLHLLLTQTPDDNYRLEVFDVETMAWRKGVALDAKPEIFTANPEVVYLCYREKSMMELHSTRDLTKSRQVNLPLPLIGIGCSQDTTEGVLCLAELINQQQSKIGEYIDWTGQRVTVSQSHGPHARLVFLSPMSLKPLPISIDQEQSQQVAFHLPRFLSDKQIRFPFSSDGMIMATRYCMLHFTENSVRVENLELIKFNTIVDNGKLLYGLNQPRRILTDKTSNGRIVYEETEKQLKGHGVIVKPVPYLDVDMEYFADSSAGLGDKLLFTQRSNGQVLMTLTGIDDLGGGIPMGRDHLRWHLVSLYQKKLVTIGNGFRQLFIRELDL